MYPLEINITFVVWTALKVRGSQTLWHTCTILTYRPLCILYFYNPIEFFNDIYFYDYGQNWIKKRRCLQKNKLEGRKEGIGFYFAFDSLNHIATR